MVRIINAIISLMLCVLGKKGELFLTSKRIIWKCNNLTQLSADIVIPLIDVTGECCYCDYLSADYGFSRISKESKSTFKYRWGGNVVSFTGEQQNTIT